MGTKTTTAKYRSLGLNFNLLGFSVSNNGSECEQEISGKNYSGDCIN